MPSVNKQQLIAVIPQYSNVIRGQQSAATITLHKNYVGNSINIGAITDVKVEYLNNDLTVFKHESKSDSKLTYGAGENKNAISVNLTGDESLALTLDDNNINGEVWIRVTITEGISPVVLPLLKYGNVYNPGQEIGDLVASRYAMPSTVYKVQNLGVDFSTSNPAGGQIFFNSDLPSQVSKIKIAVKSNFGVCFNSFNFKINPNFNFLLIFDCECSNKLRILNFLLHMDLKFPFKFLCLNCKLKLELTTKS